MFYLVLSIYLEVPSDDFDEDKVAEEMQAGFTCQGRLVRPAYVMVSSG